MTSQACHVKLMLLKHLYLFLLLLLSFANKKKRFYRDLYDMSHQHLPHQVHHFHFCNVFVVTIELVVAAFVPSVVAAFDRKVNMDSSKMFSLFSTLSRGCG